MFRHAQVALNASVRLKMLLSLFVKLSILADLNMSMTQVFLYEVLYIRSIIF